MSVRRDYCGMRLLVQVSGREAQILNRAPRGNGDLNRVTDRGRQRHPPACRHTVSPTGPLWPARPKLREPTSLDLASRTPANCRRGDVSSLAWSFSEKRV